MTREEAAEVLTHIYCTSSLINNRRDIREAFRMAIEALKAGPCSKSVCGSTDSRMTAHGSADIESTMGQLKQEGGVNDGEV